MTGQQTRLLSGATEAIGLVVASVSFVYVLGGAALALRLWLAGLPFEAAVAQVPREYLVTVGLVEVVGPALALGLIAAAGALFASGATPLGNVAVCRSGTADPVTGRLIGISGDQVLVAAGKVDEPGTIVTILQDVDQVVYASDEPDSRRACR